MRKIAFCAVLVAASLGVWLAVNSDAAKVRRVFSSIERLARSAPSEQVLESAVKAQALSRLFKDGCEVAAVEFGTKKTFSRADIAGSVLAARAGARNASVVFRDLKVLSAADGVAQVEAWVEVTGAEESPSLPSRPRRFAAWLEKTDGEWIVSRIELR